MNPLVTLLPAALDKFNNSSAAKKSANGVVDSLHQANSSLVEFTKDTRAEFVTLLDDELAHQPYIGDILQNALSMCTAYYLQAVAASTTISGVKITDRLNKINPNRGGTFVGAAGSVGKGVMSLLSYDTGLPNYLSLEDDSQSGELIPAKGRASKKELVYGGGGNSRYGEAIRAYDSMLVGKNIEVTVSESGQSVVIPVNVKLNILGAPGSEIVDILGLASRDNSTKERVYRFNAGQLKFIRDMILCDDVIKQHRKTLLTEKSGFYAATLARRQANRLAALSSGEASVAAASNIIIMSDVTAVKLEARLGGKLSTFKVREDVFSTTSTMLIFVINTKWEQVTLYTKSIGLPTQLSLRNIKVANKDGGDGILEAMQKLMAGKGI